ncbi:MAG: hypothetical protein GY820_09110 [Gammaproteobacteria bacterium]|nr:hypothetical protein [Gammaproteobacteria bacterium]
MKEMVYRWASCGKGDVLNSDQKHAKIANLLTKLRRSRVIENQGSRKSPEWVLC